MALGPRVQCDGDQKLNNCTPMKTFCLIMLAIVAVQTSALAQSYSMTGIKSPLGSGTSTSILYW